MPNVLKWLNHLPWGDAKGEECGPGPKGFWRVKDRQTERRRVSCFFFVTIKKHFRAFKLTAVSSGFEKSEGSSLFWKGYDPGKELEPSLEGQLLWLILNSWTAGFQEFQQLQESSSAISHFPPSYLSLSVALLASHFFSFVPLQTFAGWYSTGCSFGTVALGYNSAVSI